jgi:8-oxo-dGTP diphosphatase
MTRVLLLRHASAGERLSSPSLDRGRALDRDGRSDARRLPESLAGYEIEQVVTSPHTRCVDTVTPLAQAKGVELECREELAPDAQRADTLSLLDELSGGAVLCTHREVVERLFHGEVACEKGGAWLIERHDGRWTPLAYLPPPTRSPAGRRTTAV